MMPFKYFLFGKSLISFVITSFQCWQIELINVKIDILLSKKRGFQHDKSLAAAIRPKEDISHMKIYLKLYKLTKFHMSEMVGKKSERFINLKSSYKRISLLNNKI